MVFGCECWIGIGETRSEFLYGNLRGGCGAVARRLRGTCGDGILVRWAVYLAADVGGIAGPFSRGAFWDSLWPVALGLWRWENRLPKIPARDIGTAGPSCVRVFKWVGAGWEKRESPLRFWPGACLALLGVAIVLGVLLRIPH